ncbi:MAG: hypothetical protein V3U42_01715 [candidate division NC10 bacterium]|nr:hypothetical protein [candidate division NC10 bacterium]MCH7897583.1 hypothetical protein [candidate division NC10 bacterium]MCZ6550561.1 hypothetical protein [candidate division NC10 bacterium]
MDNVKASLKEARADIQLKEGHPLEVEDLRKAVVDSGFTPTWIRFEAVGQLTTRDGNPAFKVKGTDQVIPLVSDEKLKELKKAAGQDGNLISILGVIPKGKEAAQIERFQVR